MRGRNIPAPQCYNTIFRCICQYSQSPTGVRPQCGRCGLSAGGGERSATTRSEPTPARKPHMRATPAAAFTAAKAGVRGLQVPRWGAGWPKALSAPKGGFGRGYPPNRPLHGRHGGGVDPSPVTTASQVVTGRAAGAVALSGQGIATNWRKTGKLAVGVRRRFEPSRISARRVPHGGLVSTNPRHPGHKAPTFERKP
jgi:hypothetical protein